MARGHCLGGRLRGSGGRSRAGGRMKHSMRLRGGNSFAPALYNSDKGRLLLRLADYPAGFVTFEQQVTMPGGRVVRSCYILWELTIEDVDRPGGEYAR